MSDPFSELDDLLSQIEKTKVSVKKEETKAPNPKRQSQLWKSDLDNLLGEIASLDKSKPNANASNAPPPAKETKLPTLQTSSNFKPATAQVATHKTTRVPEPVNSEPALVGKLQLSAEETALSREINRARRNPKEYAAILQNERRPYFDGKILKLPNSNTMLNTEEGVSAVDEAIQFLNRVEALPEFIISLGMTSAAREALREVGSRGEFAASRSIAKLDDYGRFEVEAVELVSFGNADPREIVLRFLIGDGSPDRTHRRHIFNPDYKCLGVAVGEHKSSYKFMAIINFANMFYDK